MKAVVVGGGPAGLLSAILLADRGYQVKVFERRLAPSADELAHGPRTIIFALNQRGQHALTQAGVRLPTKDSPINGLAVAEKAGIHQLSRTGSTKMSYLDLLTGKSIFVERAALVNHLQIEAQRLHGWRIELINSRKLVYIDFDKQQATFQDTAAQQVESVTYDLLVATDGRYSKVRKLLQERDPSLDCHVVPSENSYQAFNRLQPVGQFADKSVMDVGVHFFREPSNTFRLAVWTTPYGTYSGVTDGPSEWFNGSRQEAGQPKTSEEYEAHLRNCFPTVPEEWFSLIAKQLETSPLSKSGATIKCTKMDGPATVLLGDAAHGVTPAMGQGCNSALESAYVFSQVLKDCQDDIASAVAAFTQRRVPDAHALADLDLDSAARIGNKGKLRIAYLGNLFHVLIWMALSKVFPWYFKGPLYMEMIRGNAPFDQAWKAMRRDRIIFVTLATAFTAFLASSFLRLMIRVLF